MIALNRVISITAKSTRSVTLRNLNIGTNKPRDPTFRRTTSFGVSGVGLLVSAFLWNYYKKREVSPTVLCDPQLEDKDNVTSSVTSSKRKVKTDSKLSLQQAIEKSQEIILSHKDEVGAPGIVVGVSINGKNVWTQGFGFSDLENRVPCTPNTVMRIASISKSITMAVVAKLWEDGRLDLDKPIQEYLPEYPKKKVDDKPVEITCRHLVSHLSGIRHYVKKGDIKKDDTGNNSEFAAKEYLLNERFKTVSDSLKLFENDELFHKPGEKYLYTTHGWTLVSAVVEKIIGEPFSVYMSRVFRQFGMSETYLDINECLIYNRSRYYMKSKRGVIQNSPCVDNSYKWAGGGFLSTVGDLLKFGNIMLYSYQHGEKSEGLPGYLKQETVKQLWLQVDKTIEHYKGECGYGMGWIVGNNGQQFGGGRVQRFCATHSGGAIGASSILYILPRDTEKRVAPRGVTVAIITNLQSVGFSKQAHQIALLFDQVKGCRKSKRKGEVHNLDSPLETETVLNKQSGL